MVEISQVLVDRRLSPLDASLRPEFSFAFKKGSLGRIKTIRYFLSSTPSLEGDVYRSKEKPFQREFGIIYEGKPLEYRKHYYLTIVLLTSQGQEIRATTSFFTRLSEEDWKGDWIGVPSAWNGGAVFARRELDPFDKKIKRAMAYVAGIGYSEFYVNGNKIGDEVLGPGFTAYEKKVLYRTFEITKFLTGKNDVVGVLLGNGWYGKRALKFQLYIDFEDGSQAEMHSFGNGYWRFGPSPILANSIYTGETYDARVEDRYPLDLTSPNFKETPKSCLYGSLFNEQNLGKLAPQEIEPIRVTNEIRPISKKEFAPTNFVFDLGKNISGFCRIEVQGARGAKITLRHAETLKEDGHIDQTNLRTADQEDIYILKGRGVERFSPRFTYHGFRYVEAWIDGDAELISVVGLHVHTASKRIGDFFCSDSAINALHEMAVLTEENNQHSIFTDCPQRDERFGWINDLTARLYQNSYNFDLLHFYRKVIQDINEAQDKSGAIPDIAPYLTLGCPGDTSCVSYLLLAELGYSNYGDKKILKDNYPHLKKWVDYLLTRQKGYIMDYAYYADWVSCDAFTDAKSDPIQVSSYFLFWHLKTLAHLAEILGKKKDAAYYKKLSLQSKKALNEKYFHLDHYGSSTQTENSMALSLGICPQSAYKKVYASLKQSILDHDYHLTSGSQGYRHTMAVLCQNGDADLLLKVLKNPSYPGWGYMLENGATTVWERWEKENQATMNSFDHPMFGSYDWIFYHYLLGIKLDDIFQNEVRLEPVFPNSLSEVSGSLTTPRGEIEVSYKKQESGIILRLFVPLSLQVKASFPGKKVYLEGKEMKQNPLLLKNGEYLFLLKD